MQNQNTDSILCLLLGASNLSRAYHGFVKYLERNLHPRPVRVLNALGPGRAYCVPGGLLNITYQPILDCGILAAACNNQEERVIALVTDVGNDIMYDVSAQKIIDSVGKVFGQLRDMNAEIVATLIPDYLETKMDSRQFRCLRAVFFPNSKVEQDQVVASVRELNRFLRSQESRHFTLVSGLEEFYWFDKIHFSPLQMHKAWTKIAKEMFRVLGVEASDEITRAEMISSLGAQVIRLIMCDAFRIYKKSAEYF